MYTMCSITYAMRSTSIFLCIVTMISNFTIFLSFKYLFSDVFYKYNMHFHMISATLLLINYFYILNFFFFFSLRALFRIHFLHNLYLCIHQRYWCWFNSNVLLSLEGITTLQISFFHILFYEIQVFFCCERMKAIQTIKITVMFASYSS